MILTHESGAQEDQFDEKKRRPKISWYYPFNVQRDNLFCNTREELKIIFSNPNTTGDLDALMKNFLKPCFSGWEEEGILLEADKTRPLYLASRYRVATTPPIFPVPGPPSHATPPPPPRGKAPPRKGIYY